MKDDSHLTQYEIAARNQKWFEFKHPFEIIPYPFSRDEPPVQRYKTWKSTFLLALYSMYVIAFFRTYGWLLLGVSILLLIGYALGKAF